jgi:hypothetical protein
MTSQSPRIYVYKITFEEVPYYYYGVHKEKRFNEYYMGSPVTHKWCWEFYTPKKQILEIFEFSDEGWVEANIVEDRLIKPFYNTDKWCLNENCGGITSLDIKREVGIMNYKLKKGFFNYTKEERIQVSRNGGKSGGKRGGNITKELGIGVHGLTKEQRSENGKKGARKAAQTNEKNKTGLYGLSTEKRRENAKITNSQRWECCITGYVSTAAGVVSYQKGKRIDTSKSNRRKVV